MHAHFRARKQILHARARNVRRNFHALTRLDENRAKCQLALKSGKFYTSVSRVAVWGNHSTTQVRARCAALKVKCTACTCMRMHACAHARTHTHKLTQAHSHRHTGTHAHTHLQTHTLQVPDFLNAKIGGLPAMNVIRDPKYVFSARCIAGQGLSATHINTRTHARTHALTRPRTRCRWFKEEFTPKVAQRGGALIKKWGRSSAASTAVRFALSSDQHLPLQLALTVSCAPWAASPGLQDLNTDSRDQCVH